MELLKIKASDFIALVNNYQIGEKNSDVKDRINIIFKKMKPTIMANFSRETLVHIFVVNVDRFVSDNHTRSVEKFINLEEVLLLEKILESNDLMEKPDSIFLAIHKYNSDHYECLQFMNNLLSTVSLTRSGSREINLPALDAILSHEPKYYAKHARKSVSRTLLELKQSRQLKPRVNEKGWVSYDFASKQSELLDRYVKCRCPVCDTTYTIEASNIDSLISVTKQGKATMKCQHLHTLCQKEQPFRIDIKELLPPDFDNRTAKLFFAMNIMKLHERSKGVNG
jgi:hypothetical protein